MNPPADMPAIAHIVQLAVAPVFLLSSIAAVLGVLASRLGRIVDRARVLESRVTAEHGGATTTVDAQLAVLARRARLVNLALTLGVSCGLLVCLVIVTLFLGVFLHMDLSRLLGVLFVGAMLAFVSTLVVFLREIFLSTATLRIGRH